MQTAFQTPYISGVDMNKLMAEARAERAKMMRAIFAKVFRRLDWNRTAQPRGLAASA